MNRKQIISLLLLGASIIYDFLPVDLLPDMPVVGWLDDVLVTSSAALNCVQQFSSEDNQLSQRILSWLKWACLLFAILIILVVLLLASTLMALMK